MSFSTPETATMHLHITNDQDMYDHARDVITNAIDDEGALEEQYPEYHGAPRIQAADELKEYYESRSPAAAKPSVYGDLLQHALDSINWLEIVNALIDG